jgi:hypothetical protein
MLKSSNDELDGAWLSPRRFSLMLAVCLAAAFPQVVAGIDTFYYRDFGVLAYPWIHYQRDCFWQGELPLWNPYSHCGVPFLAQWSINFYPFSLLYLVLPLPWSLNMFCLLHLFWAGLGMYFLVRRWMGNSFAAGVAGLGLVFNGVTQSCLAWPNYTVVLGWMPWVVLCAERGWREGGRWVLMAGMVSALQLLSGVPEVILFTWLLLGGLWILDFGKAAATRAALVGRMSGIIGIAAALAAVQLLPFFDLLAHCQRDRHFATMKWAMPGWGWANLLVPLFHCYESSDGPWFQKGQDFFGSYYLGAGVLVLAIWAAWRVRQPRIGWLALLVLLSLILALGNEGPLFGWVQSVFPLVGVARYPVKFMLLAAFILPVLAAAAFTRLNGASPEKPREAGPLLILAAMALATMGFIVWFGWRYPFEFDQPKATLVNALARAACLVFLVGLVLWLRHPQAGRKRMMMQSAVLLTLLVDLGTHTPRQNPTISASSLAPGMWGLGSALVREGDLTNVTSLIEKLRGRADRVSEFLWTRLSAPGQHVLVDPRSSLGQRRAVLAEELNRILGENSLYEAQRFAGIPLAEATRRLLAENPQGDELFRLNRLLVEDAYPREVAPTPVQFRPPEPAEARVLISPQAEAQLLRGRRSKTPLEEFVGRRLAQWSNLNLVDRVPKVYGAITLRLREQYQIESLLVHHTNGLPAGLLDFLAVSHLTSPDDATRWIVRTNFCPLITCGQKPVFADAPDIQRALMAAEFNPREIVYLPRESRPQVTVKHRTGCQVRTQHFSAGRVRLEVEAQEPSLVVIAQSYHPAWHASVDHRLVPLLRANHAFQALQVPPGVHTITLVYQDQHLFWGAILSLSAVLAGAGLWWRGRPSEAGRCV